MIRRVVYLVESPLGLRDFERFGVGGWAASGVDVEVWEVDELFLPRERPLLIERPADCVIRQFSSMKVLSAACRGLTRETAVIVISGVFLGEFVTHRPMLVALMKSSAVLTTVSAGQRPLAPLDPEGPHAASRVTDRISWQLHTLRTRQTTIADLALKVAQRIGASAFLMRSRLTRSGWRALDWIWVGTDIDSIDPLFIGVDTQIRYLHSWDYDLILRMSGADQTRPAAPVYLDAMGPLHPDFDVLPYEVEVDADQWFRVIDEALTQIERSLGEPVVIAAHPRAPRGSLESVYPAREVRYGQTAALIASASVVLFSDPTTALGMAAIHRKPAVAIRVPRLWDGHWLEMEEYVGMLGLEVLDVGNIPVDWVPRAVDSDAYAGFLERYVKRQGTPESPFWEEVRRDLLSF